MRVEDAFAEEPVSKRVKLETTAYGNYRSYYGKRKFVGDRDSRLAQLPVEWVKGHRVCDVGCNSGKVTVELAQRFAPYRVIGVDLDGELIRAANKQIRERWSSLQPLPHLQAAADQLERKKSAETNGHKPAAAELDYFPASMSKMFGMLPYAPAELMSTLEDLDEEEQKARAKPGGRGKAMPREIRLFPENIKFKTADWLNEDIDSDRQGYDLILAFSITKWIHLNEGDKGIKDFFAKAFECLRPEGRFVLEPQPWTSYAKARKMGKDLQANYAKLELRPDDFSRILLDEIGFQSVQELGKAGEGGFERPLLVFSKAKGSWI